MNKNELIAAVSEKTEIHKKDVTKIFDVIVETITEELKNDNKVEIYKFGTFDTIKKPAREGRNPRTGETIQIAAFNSPKFSFAKVMKEALN